MLPARSFTAIDSDANNVHVTLLARAMRPALFIVARANAEGSKAKLHQAGASRVVSPYTMAGGRIAELASRLRVVDLIDAALSHGNLSFSLEEVEVAAESPLVGVTVGALRDDGVVTLAILQASGADEANPPASRTVHAGESLILSGFTDVLEALAPARDCGREPRARLTSPGFPLGRIPMSCVVLRHLATQMTWTPPIAARATSPKADNSATYRCRAW